MRSYALAILLVFLCRLSVAQEAKDTDLLIVGGDESGCAAAIQAARLGVKRIVLINDIEWLGASSVLKESAQSMSGRSLMASELTFPAAVHSLKSLSGYRLTT